MESVLVLTAVEHSGLVRAYTRRGEIQFVKKLEEN